MLMTLVHSCHWVHTIMEPLQKRIKYSSVTPRKCVMDLTDDGDSPILDGALLVKKLTGFPLGVSVLIQDYATVNPVELVWDGLHTSIWVEKRPPPCHIQVKQDRPGHLRVTTGCPLLYLDLDYQNLSGKGQVYLWIPTQDSIQQTFRPHLKGQCCQCTRRPETAGRFDLYGEHRFKMTMTNGFLQVFQDLPISTFTFKMFIL